MTKYREKSRILKRLPLTPDEFANMLKALKRIKKGATIDGYTKEEVVVALKNAIKIR